MYPSAILIQPPVSGARLQCVPFHLPTLQIGRKDAPQSKLVFLFLLIGNFVEYSTQRFLDFIYGLSLEMFFTLRQLRLLPSACRIANPLGSLVPLTSLP